MQHIVAMLHEWNKEHWIFSQSWFCSDTFCANDGTSFWPSLVVKISRLQLLCPSFWVICPSNYRSALFSPSTYYCRDIFVTPYIFRRHSCNDIPFNWLSDCDIPPGICNIVLGLGLKGIVRLIGTWFNIQSLFKLCFPRYIFLIALIDWKAIDAFVQTDYGFTLNSIVELKISRGLL